MGKKKKKKKKHIDQEELKKTENKTVYLLVILVIINFLIRNVYSTETIGGKSGYFIYFFLIPTIIGIAIISFLKLSFLKQKLNEAKSLIDKFGLSIIYLIQGFLFSFLTFGLISNIIWTSLTLNNTSGDNSIFIDCPITDINDKSRYTQAHIYFTFNKEPERLDLNYNLYLKYYKSETKDLKVSLELQPVILDYFVIKDWQILKK